MSSLPQWAAQLVEAARHASDDATAALQVAVEFGSRLPEPGRGQTAVRWALLSAVAEVDLTVARVLEAHSDALAILAEAGLAPPAGSWGVFAAEAPGIQLDAKQTVEGWSVTGTKPWCSLGGRLDHALVTARTDDGRRLFVVSLRDSGVRADRPQAWVARGLRSVATVPVHFEQVTAKPIGSANWYLTRPGFAWGGLGVAACWLGGVQALTATLRDALAGARRGGPVGEMHLGAVDVALFTARTVMQAAAAAIDVGEVDDGEMLALRVRAVVADAVELTLRHVGHALGPAPLGFDPVHVRRVADLQLYVRQHHGERDLATLGAHLLAGRRIDS
jgi:alkylation response protein AidB-like acyl-CoA dehydrogenase